MILGEMYNVEKRSFDQGSILASLIGTQEKRLFKEIHCYGVVPSLCVRHQVEKLETLAFKVYTHGFYFSKANIQ